MYCYVIVSNVSIVNISWYSKKKKKFKVDSVQNCFVIYRKLLLSFIASKNLKPFFTLDYVLKRANDLKTKKKKKWCRMVLKLCFVLHSARLF